LKNTTTSNPPTANDMNGWVAIPNSDAPTYNPGSISQTTWYLRCARRTGCTDYNGESNIIEKAYQSSCGGGNDNTYCNSQGNSSHYEWIKRVTFGSIDNNSGKNGGYGDFTSMSTNIHPGHAQSITLTPGFAGSAYKERWRVWVDWNQDGDFNDYGEKEVQTASRWTVTKTISAPYNAAIGATRMRVSMRYGSYPSSCQNFSEGEVEDYTINVVPQSRQVSSNQLQLIATYELDAVDLTWVNNSGSQNEKFILEKSTDGINFEPIMELASSDSEEMETYIESDDDPLEGNNYYRVKLIYTDQTTTYSNIQRVEVVLSKDELTVFPNPAAYEVFVSMKELAGKSGTLSISNQMGKVVYQRSYQVIPLFADKIELKNMPSGVYFITVLADGRRQITKRLVVIDEN